ncbi:MAG: hypothetical protein ACF788_03515 [Novipirellula sp. JB048]
MMKTNRLSDNSRKALIVNIGESAGKEVADLIAQMAAEIEELRQTKVSVTPIVPGVRDRVAMAEEPV